MTEYGTTFAAWRAAAGDHWPAYTRHAFVEGLCDGTLPREAFLVILHQIIQKRLARQGAIAQPLDKGMARVGMPVISRRRAPCRECGAVIRHFAFGSMASVSTGCAASIKPASCRKSPKAR